MKYEPVHVEKQVTELLKVSGKVWKIINVFVCMARANLSRSNIFVALPVTSPVAGRCHEKDLPRQRYQTTIPDCLAIPVICLVVFFARSWLLDKALQKCKGKLDERTGLETRLAFRWFYGLRTVWITGVFQCLRPEILY